MQRIVLRHLFVPSFILSCSCWVEMLDTEENFLSSAHVMALRNILGYGTDTLKQKESITA